MNIGQLRKGLLSMATKQSVLLNDLQSFHKKFNRINKISDKESPILSGLFQIQNFHNGLTIHASDAVESRNANIVTEIPPGISFNFLFTGTIDFSFGNQKYRIENHNLHPAAQGSFIIANQAEIFTRYLKDGMQIKKLNIFVSQEWLVNRCESQADRNVVNTLFNHAGVYTWQPDDEAIQKAEALLQSKRTQTLSDKLISEHATVALLISCLDHAYQAIKSSKQTKRASVFTVSSQLKSKVDHCLSQCFSLPEIAGRLNMSVSTLQRHFKRDYGLNISNYIKQRRLTLARKSLLVGDMSIGEVAFDSGYKYASNFICAFKKQFGLTPAAYIKVHTMR